MSRAQATAPGQSSTAAASSSSMEYSLATCARSPGSFLRRARQTASCSRSMSTHRSSGSAGSSALRTTALCRPSLRSVSSLVRFRLRFRSAASRARRSYQASFCLRSVAGSRSEAWSASSPSMWKSTSPASGASPLSPPRVGRRRSAQSPRWSLREIGRPAGSTGRRGRRSSCGSAAPSARTSRRPGGACST